MPGARRVPVPYVCLECGRAGTTTKTSGRFFCCKNHSEKYGYRNDPERRAKKLANTQRYRDLRQYA